MIPVTGALVTLVPIRATLDMPTTIEIYSPRVNGGLCLHYPRRNRVSIARRNWVDACVVSDDLECV